MENKIINTDIIGVVTEVNDKVEYSEMAIIKHTEFIEELKDMVKNPNRTLMDLQNYFELHFKGSPKYINYCKCYSCSYVDWEDRPISTEFQNYKTELEGVEARAKSRYSNQKASLEEYIEAELARHKIFLKRIYFEHCESYINALDYSQTYSQLMSRPEIKMASTSSIGWNTHSYKITEDVDASVFSNFAYGRASTFALTLSYKGVKIVPYSYWTEYAFANMDDLRRYTRLYNPSRENWAPCLQTTADAAQIAKSGANKFYEKFIVNEIEEMMSGLRRINSCTTEDLKKWIETRHGHDEYIFVRDFSSRDRNNYVMYPEEFVFGIKIEKLSGALNFMEDLKSIEGYYERVRTYIQEIKSINQKLVPEIDSFLNKIKIDIDLLAKEIEKLEKKLEEIEESISLKEKELEPYENMLEKTIEAKLLTKEELVSEYSIRESERKNLYDKYPEYKLLSAKRDALQENKDSVFGEKVKFETELHYRESLSEQLDTCKSNINELAK